MERAGLEYSMLPLIWAVADASPLLEIIRG
jgi:hypothetical protein